MSLHCRTLIAEARSSAVLAFALVAAAACGNQTVGTEPTLELAATDSVVLQTDAAEYHWQTSGGLYSTHPVVTIRNAGTSTVYLPECNPGFAPPLYSIEREAPDAGKVFVFTETMGRACLQSPRAVELKPGESRRDTLFLSSTSSPNASPPIDPSQRVGSFRISYLIYARSRPDGTIDETSLLAAPQRRSNTFQLAY